MHPTATWLWHLLPTNPIVVRTVQGASRRMRHLWIRMAYLGVLIAIVGFGLLALGGSGASNMAELAKAGTIIFAFVSYAQVALICLLAPLFMAGAISQEQSGKTYEILFTTPMTNLQVVLGSLLGRLFFVLALLLSGLPLFAFLLIFGGVPIASVFVAFTVAGLVALLVGSVAVMLAVLQTGGRKSVFLFVTIIASYLVAAWVLDRNMLRVAPHTTWLTPLHPLLVLEASINRANYRPPDAEALAHLPGLMRFYLGRPFAAFACLTGIVSTALIVLSTVFARGIVQNAGAVVWLRRWLRLGARGEERRHEPRAVRGNPISWREAHTRGNHVVSVVARWGFVVLTIVVLLVALLKYHGAGGAPAAGQAFRVTLTVLLLFELAVIVMVAIYTSAGAVSSEREDGTLDLILTTPITPHYYVWGKLHGLVRFLGVLLAAPILTMTIVSAYTVIGNWFGWPTAQITETVVGGKTTHELILFESPLLLAAILVPSTALCVMAGMFFSLRSKGVLGAVIPSIALIGAASFVLGWCGFYMASEVPFLGPIVNGFSPATSIIMLINPWLHVDDFSSDPVFGRMSLFMAAVVSAGGYSLMVYSIQVGMVKTFDHTVRKLSGTG